ncbi:polysaccharide deacetylase family protein [Exilibacterium tricleocarpae]|uniref:Polysaccharide deacetylase family protein n=1 Tax=Exilibacterium tricleocarpae TaxID=2591008 RepID=A0A545TVR1_9GAMM|nr:polysaccharide deacetylase family protein [Exilibacterium tricleocarpae]TQV81241.1 polysaccharide deacetylase family protein [Exilibacterium tricleocarpae]
MALDDNYLQYPQRRYGMDHDRYTWSMLADRKPVTWPGGKKIALWVNVALQFFPLNQRGQPFKAPGGMTMPYPDLRHFTLRDYGNRVGIYRFFQAFDQYGVKPTMAINTRLAERAPYLLEQILSRGDEIVCHGWHMDALHYGGQDPTEEAEQVERAVTRLRQLSGRAVRGWISPARNESEQTPDLLAANGIEYFCDWVNDDMPYPFTTRNGVLTAMPLSMELEDRFILMNNLHSEDAYKEQVIDAFDFLLEEAQREGGRILSLSIHPWMLGQPHRIGRLEQVLAYITGHNSVWSATAGEILDAFNVQQG